VTHCDGVSLLQDCETTQENGELIQEGKEVLRRRTPTLPVLLEKGSSRKTGTRSRKECESLLHRLRKDGNNLLDKGVTTQNDKMFEAEESSIGKPGASCGDTAKGAAVLCSNYNSWLDLRSIFELRAKTIQSAQKCLKASVKSGNCLIQNKCSDAVKVSWESSEVHIPKGKTVFDQKV